MTSKSEGHPLFPPRDDDDEPPNVQIIHVFREENNQLVMVPRQFSPSDIMSEDQIYNLYGGGKYEIRSRGQLPSGRQGITAKRGIVLPGAPKPLYDGPAQPLPGQAATPAAQQAAVQPGAPNWLPIMATLLPLLLQWLSGQQESQRMDRASQQALLTAMMKQSQDSNAQMITLLATLNRPSGGTTQEGFQDGMKFLQDFLAGQAERAQAEKAEKGEEAGIMQMISDLSQAMDLVGKFSDAGAGSPPPVAPPIVETVPT